MQPFDIAFALGGITGKRMQDAKRGGLIDSA